LNIIDIIANEFGFRKFQVANTIELQDGGATVPFIARYRKEKTGTLTETEIRTILDKYAYYTELDERKETILASIEKQGFLTDELKRKINQCTAKTELEDFYLPYKPKRMTRGKKAAEAGLKPLASLIKNCVEPNLKIELEAEGFITFKSMELGFDNIEKVMAGACDIIAEELSNNALIRKILRKLAHTKGVLISKVKKTFATKKTKFDLYYDYNEPVKSASSHRILAMLRGEKEKILTLKLSVPERDALLFITEILIKYPRSATKYLLRKTAEDALNRLLMPAVETEIRNHLIAYAEEEAMKVFCENLKNLLLTPPAGRKSVIGLDPGFRTGCKMVAIDNTGKLLENNTIYPTAPKNDIAGTRKVILNTINRFNIELIAIGNGTASRETEKIVRELINVIPASERPQIIIVNESGASVYSASQIAIDEFPDYDITVRGAVSIARRIQDPLSELVKIDPKAIGVGQYQHDVNQSKLKQSLEAVVESCVNSVGVNLNLASAELLKFVSGLNKKIADNIVQYRNEHGAFKSRKELKKVKGVGLKTFEQSAGFLRIPNGKNPLDNSAVHPERYELVEKMAADLKTTLANLIDNEGLIEKIEIEKYISDDTGKFTIEDIIAELKKPGRDPREEFKYAQFDDSINEIGDLHIGMHLEGVISNVTNFGAFADIGVHQDGLIHISQMADKYVSNPAEIVKVGQVVNLTVIEVDTERNRISLSMKKQ